MVVNPQLFNYRLIISSLLVVLTVLGVFSFTNYKSNKSYEEFLKQEKSLIEIELSELLTSYDELTEDYDFMAVQLQDAKLETKIALDSLRLSNGNLSIISKFKNQLTVLKSKSKALLNTIDSLNAANIELKRAKRYAENTIKKKTIVINELEEVNDSLNKAIDNASILKASSIEARAFKLKSGNKRFTDKAKRANSIDVCITLAENPLTEKGRKDIYIQIVSPAGNVISDRGEITFGDASLIYSKKEVVNYNNKTLEICTEIKAENEDQPFIKGYYFINVFNENTKLGSTSIKLK
jgi:hypothetical protein